MAILNYWLSEIRFKLPDTACLLVIIRSLLNSVHYFPQILNAEKMKLHQSLYFIKALLSIGSITISTRTDLSPKPASFCSSHIPSVCHLLIRTESLKLKICCKTNIYRIPVMLMHARASIIMPEHCVYDALCKYLYVLVSVIHVIRKGGPWSITQS